MPLLDLDQVIQVHDAIIEEYGGVAGFANGGRGGVEGALTRIEMHQMYDGMDDVFSIAALYATALARGHVFNDGNKRTGLACCLNYLLSEEIRIPENADFEDAVVYLAEGKLTSEEFAGVLYLTWTDAGQPSAPLEAV